MRKRTLVPLNDKKTLFCTYRTHKIQQCVLFKSISPKSISKHNWKTMSSPYVPEVDTEQVKLFGFFGPKVDIVSLGKYKILVFPKAIRDQTFFFGLLNLKTCLIPRPRAWMTFAFQIACFLILSWFAAQFAARPMTTPNLIADGILVSLTVGAGLATSMTDPGILPPELPEIEDDADELEASRREELDPTSASSPKSSSKQRDEEDEPTHNPYLSEADEEYRNTDEYKLYKCKYCKHLRPSNTAHCPKCLTCVMGFDHHCSFLQTDCGKNNLRYFIVFILLSLTCVVHSFIVFVKPFVNLIVFQNADLLQLRKIQSNFALAVGSVALFAWSVLMAFMVSNYLVMLFVPGSKSTREVWRKWCGSGKKPAAPASPPLPDWHPGYAKQQKELQQQQSGGGGGEPMRFWKVCWEKTSSSLLPRWVEEVLGERDEDGGSAPPPMAIASTAPPSPSHYNNSESEKESEKEPLVVASK